MKAEYDLIEEQWLGTRKTLPEKDLKLFELFEDGLCKNALILDLGCGHGTPVAKFLSNKGHRILGVDRSAKLLAHAKRQMPEHEWILDDLESYEPDQTFDGIVIWDSLFHLPRKEHIRLLRKAYNALKPAGMMIISSGGSNHEIPAFTDFMFDVEFFYDSFPVGELLKNCETIGFKILQSSLLDEPDGERNKGRLGVVLKKV